ncbi:MAG: TatD family hydrolase [Fimbriiglobus sp.]
MNWIDTHAHLDDGRFSGDLEAVLANAQAAGLVRILTIGIDLTTSRNSLRLAKQHPHIISAVVGIQPNHASEAQPPDFAEIERMAEATEVVAIGESGLDRYWDRAPFQLQQDYFRRHFELCRRVQKPIIIHCREAEADVVAMLQAEFDAHGPVAGVMHSFSGDAATAQKCVELGLHISFAGMLTYKTAEPIREAAKVVPLDRLLVETDSPYLAPIPKRGQRNEPAYVIHTAQKLAELRDLPIDQLATITTANAQKLFKLS